MAESVILLVLLVSLAKSSVAQYRCNSSYQPRDICIVENVVDSNVDRATFPPEPYMQLLRPQIPRFDKEMFKRLPHTTHLEMRDGFVREVLFQSPVLKALHLINTNLVTLEALSEPNFSLKQLMVRSPMFSRWSTSLKVLKGLERIDISYCNFTYVSLEWFAVYPNLNFLDMSKNKLVTVYSPPGLKLTALEDFYVAGNQLEFLWRFPDAFPKVKRVGLSDNRWMCDWVSKTRDAIFLQRMMSMSMDVSCPKGWEMNGGLCCNPRVDEKEKLRLKDVRPVDCLISVIQKQKRSC